MFSRYLIRTLTQKSQYYVMEHVHPHVEGSNFFLDQYIKTRRMSASIQGCKTELTFFSQFMGERYLIVHSLLSTRSPGLAKSRLRAAKARVSFFRGPIGMPSSRKSSSFRMCRASRSIRWERSSEVYSATPAATRNRFNASHLLSRGMFSSAKKNKSISNIIF